MNGPQKKKELSSEMRILLASVLSLLVIIGWAKFFAPKAPVNPRPQAPEAISSAPVNPAHESGPAGQGSASNAPAATAKASAPATPPKADTQERTIVVENDLYRVEFSNRGAVVRSWQLKKYMDDAKPPRVLDVVHPEASQQTGGWPLSLVLNDPKDEAAANSALYRCAEASNELKAPAELSFEWSDGHLEVAKSFHFDHSYVVRVETTVKLNGQPIMAGLAWRGGFGDLTVHDPAPIEQTFIFYGQGGKVQFLPHKKLGGPEQLGSGWQTGTDFAGIEDRYFAAAFLPANGAAPGGIETRFWKLTRAVQVADRQEQEPVAEVAATTSAQPADLRIYVGPKDYDDLKKMNPPLHALVQFGWFEFIADPLFHLLKWLHDYIPNWGWAIILLTVAINMLLFPLRISSYRTSLKMQRVAPEVKQIQEKYKKYKMNDPKKQEMNQQIMAIYKREGINPAGGCLPMLLQFPIWIGLNSALRGAIELRHAPWIWIRDLASKDPYYILPVGVGVTMYLVSKMTPMTTTDPQQQAMMKFMPLMFSVSFVIFPFSSGLALYILTSSVIGIAQQWYLNRKHPAPAPVKPARGKK